MDCEDDTPDPWAAPGFLTHSMARWSVGRGVRSKRRFDRKTTERMKTTGRPGPGAECFVYIAKTSRAIKVGVTSNVERRMRGLRANLLLALPVVYEAAREVEGHALTILGNRKGKRSEWVIATDEQAMAALRQAWEAVGRYRHVDPALTAEEARQHRIVVASNHALV